MLLRRDAGARARSRGGARSSGSGTWRTRAKAGTEPLLTGCASCFSRLRAVRAGDARSIPSRGGSGARAIGLPVDPRLEVLHIAQVLAAPEMREKLARQVKRPLTRPQGRLLLRLPADPPARRRTRSMTPRIRSILEDLVRLAGAEPVDWPLRLDCCGASMALPAAGSRPRAVGQDPGDGPRARGAGR